MDAWKITIDSIMRGDSQDSTIQKLADLGYSLDYTMRLYNDAIDSICEGYNIYK